MTNPSPKENLVCGFLILFLVKIPNMCNAVSVCDMDDDPSLFKTMMIYKEQTCYFLVTGSDIESIDPDGFTLEKARTVCKRHNSTLPSSRSKDEAEFLIKYFKDGEDTEAKNESVIALGLKQVPGKDQSTTYEWDDNSALSYQDPNWSKVEKNWQYTGLIQNNTWVDANDNILSEYTFVVVTICKQPYRLSLSTPAAAIAIPSTIEGTHCHEHQKEEYIRAKVFNNSICYFTVSNGTAFANQKSRTTGEVGFDLNRARIICAKHNGTLPIIHSAEELRFVVEQIFYKGHDHVILDPDSSEGNLTFVWAIALGLKQENNSNGYHYKWDDGSNLDYVPAKWIGKNETASFTVINTRNESLSWYNNIHWPQTVPIAVICRQLHAQPPAIRTSLKRQKLTTSMSQISTITPEVTLPDHIKNDREPGSNVQLPQVILLTTITLTLVVLI